MLSRGEQYDQAFGFLVDAFRRAKRTLPNSIFVPALVDFTATVGFAADGEAGVREMTAQLMRRAAEAREGRFPLMDDGAEDGSEADAECDKAMVAAAIQAITAGGDNPTYPRLAQALQLYKRRVIEAADRSGLNPMLVSEDNTEDIVATDAAMSEMLDHLTDAAVPVNYLLDFFADFVAYITLRLTNDEAILRAKMKRLESRLKEWKAGEAPVLA